MWPETYEFATTVATVICIILGAALSLGYVLRKQYGYRHGYLEGQAGMRLLLRQQSLEQGRCVFRRQNYEVDHAGMKPESQANNSLQEGSS